MNEATLTKKVGAEIRRLRQVTGLSQEDFADQCGLHRTYVGAIERGEKRLTIETASKVLRALNTKFSDFFRQIGE